MNDPKQCSMLDCNKPIGPDALEFTHRGVPAGGICENCLEDSAAIRVLFRKNAENIYEPSEMIEIKEI